MDRRPEEQDAQENDAVAIAEFTWLWSSFNEAGRNLLKDMMRSAASQPFFFKVSANGKKSHKP